jgi:hypothetical protein
MGIDQKLSRRAVVVGLGVTSAKSTTLAAQNDSPDVRLIALGHEFDEITTQWDCAAESGSLFAGEYFERLGRIDREIVVTEAKTTEGLLVKARAACWARLGDLDPLDEPTTDRRMALSIVRDLIRLHDPSREVPNALRDLVAEKERDAG